VGTTELIVPEDLPEAVVDAPAASGAVGGDHRTVTEEQECAILAVLSRAGGSYTEAAKLLGAHPNYFAIAKGLSPGRHRQSKTE
jgi:hypothetical protein